MKVLEVFNKYTIIAILLNCLIFYTAQHFFFNYIISKQLEKVVLDKVEILKLLMKEDENIKNNILNNINEEFDTVKENSAKIKASRHQINKGTTFKFIAIPIVILITLIIFFFLNIKTTQRFNSFDFISIIAIFLAYVSEIYFLFMIVKKYIHIGDFKIINYVAEKLLISEKDKVLEDVNLRISAIVNQIVLEMVQGGVNVP